MQFLNNPGFECYSHLKARQTTSIEATIQASITSPRAGRI